MKPGGVLGAGEPRGVVDGKVRQELDAKGLAATGWKATQRRGGDVETPDTNVVGSNE